MEVHREMMDTKKVLGRYGIEKKNDKGVETLALLQSYGMRVASTLFKYSEYSTWMSFCTPDRTHHQMDHWITNSMKMLDTQKYQP